MSPEAGDSTANPYKEYRSHNPLFAPVMLDGRPYAPSLQTLKPGSAPASSVMGSCVAVVLQLNKLAGFFAVPGGCGPDDVPAGDFEVERVSGGITNGLFRVASERHGLTGGRRLLVRVFGAEGMIDRDVETSVYAALCRCKVGAEDGYLARFGNGRVEGEWVFL